MRLPALLLLLITALVPLLRADEPKAARYTAVVTGIVCQSCKTTVVDSLKKLPGVKDVDFAKGDKEGSHKLTFDSSSGSLTKNDAELALGEHVKEFAIVSFDRAK